MKPCGKYALITVLLLCGGVALAGTEEKKKIRVSTQAAITTAHVSSLPPTIKIDMKGLPKDLKEIKALNPAFYDAWKRVVQSYGALVALIPQFEEARRVYRAKCQECASRNYTQADMAAAGCLPSDTMGQCSAKLFRWCIAPYERGVLSLSMFVNFGALSNYSKIAEQEFYNSIMKK